jgi:hypothetical protein
MSNRQEIQKAISETWGIAFVIRWVAFKIYPNVKWWTEPNHEGVSNMDALEVVTLFIIPYVAFLWFVVKPCV